MSLARAISYVVPASHSRCSLLWFLAIHRHRSAHRPGVSTQLNAQETSDDLWTHSTSSWNYSSSHCPEVDRLRTLRPYTWQQNTMEETLRAATAHPDATTRRRHWTQPLTICGVLSVTVKLGRRYDPSLVKVVQWVSESSRCLHELSKVQRLRQRFQYVVQVETLLQLLISSCDFVCLLNSIRTEVCACVLARYSIVGTHTFELKQNETETALLSFARATKRFSRPLVVLG